MNDSVNFKYGSTLEGKTINDGDFVAINKSLAKDAVESDARYGSIYKGDKILGTTEADKMYTTDDITIAGGPLANYFDDVYTGGKIPAGTSLQSLLTALACVEKWPNPAAKGSWGTLTSTFPKMADVSATADGKVISSGTLVEVGSSVTFGAYSGKDVSSNTPSLTFDNFSYGYATTTGKHAPTKTESNPASVTATVIPASDPTYTLTRTYEKFTQQEGADTATSKIGNSGSGISFVSDTVTVAVGTNKVTYGISVDKQVHSAKVKAPAVYYALSNLGNTDKNGAAQQTVDYTTEHTYTPNPAIPTSPDSATFNVVGVKPVYFNINDGAFEADTNIRYALQTAAVFEFIKTPAEGTYKFMFDYPATHVVSKFEMRDPSGEWKPVASNYNVDSLKGHFKTIQGVKHPYKRLTTAGGAGEQNYRITLNKTLDQD